MPKRRATRPVQVTDADKSLFGARIGDRVLLRDGHPWAGYTGRVVVLQRSRGSESFVVKLDGSRQLVHVLYRNDIEVLP